MTNESAAGGTAVLNRSPTAPLKPRTLRSGATVKSASSKNGKDSRRHHNQHKNSLGHHGSTSSTASSNFTQDRDGDHHFDKVESLVEVDEEITSIEDFQEEESTGEEAANTVDEAMLTVALVQSVVEEDKAKFKASTSSKSGTATATALTNSTKDKSITKDTQKPARYGLRKRRRPTGEDLKRLEHFQSSTEGGLAKCKKRSSASSLVTSTPHAEGDGDGEAMVESDTQGDLVDEDSGEADAPYATTPVDTNDNNANKTTTADSTENAAAGCDTEPDPSGELPRIPEIASNPEEPDPGITPSTDTSNRTVPDEAKDQCIDTALDPDAIPGVSEVPPNESEVSTRSERAETLTDETPVETVQETKDSSMETPSLSSNLKPASSDSPSTKLLVVPAISVPEVTMTTPAATSTLAGTSNASASTSSSSNALVRAAPPVKTKFTSRTTKSNKSNANKSQQQKSALGGTTTSVAPTSIFFSSVPNPLSQPLNPSPIILPPPPKLDVTAQVPLFVSGPFKVPCPLLENPMEISAVLAQTSSSVETAANTAASTLTDKATSSSLPPSEAPIKTAAAAVPQNVIVSVTGRASEDGPTVMEPAVAAVTEDKRKVTISEPPISTRTRGFSIELDLGIDFVDDASSSAPQTSEGNRDRAFSFECFAFGINADEPLPPLDQSSSSYAASSTGQSTFLPHPYHHVQQQQQHHAHSHIGAADSDDAHNNGRPRGDSIIFDPTSFHEGGIHEKNALERRPSQSVDFGNSTLAKASAALSSSENGNTPTNSVKTDVIPNMIQGAYNSNSATNDVNGVGSGSTPNMAPSSSASLPTADTNQLLSSSGEGEMITTVGGVAANTNASAAASLELVNKDGRIGIYLPEARRARISRFHAKRAQRIWRKRIKYDCRKKLADSRPRIKGRFVKRTDMDDD